MLTAFKLLVTAGLGVLYLGVAFLAAHPRVGVESVDSEYAAHFLRRAADCWVPRSLRPGDVPPDPPASLDVAEIGYPDLCLFLRRDWYRAEDWGVWSIWSNDQHVILRLPRKPGAREVELTLQGLPAPGPMLHARFVLNGRTTEAEIPAGTTKAVGFPLPPSGERYDPDMRIYSAEHAVVPNLEPLVNADRPPPPGRTRFIGVGLVAIRYLPARPEAAPSGDAPAPG